MSGVTQAMRVPEASVTPSRASRGPRPDHFLASAPETTAPFASTTRRRNSWLGGSQMRTAAMSISHMITSRDPMIRPKDRTRPGISSPGPCTRRDSAGGWHGALARRVHGRHTHKEHLPSPLPLSLPGRDYRCHDPFLEAGRSAAGGSGPDERKGQGGDRQLPARDPQAAREAAKPGRDSQPD
jgi:hypothetical protein